MLLFLNEIVWYENLNSEGEFSSRKILYKDKSGIRKVSARDIDNDRDLDIVATLILESVIVLENLGAMNFSLSDIILLGEGNYTDVVGLYLNDDEYIDLCVPTVHGFFTIINSGLITDVAKENNFHQSEGFTAYKMQVVDMNLDSKEDIVSCWIGGNKLGLYTNMTMPTSSVSYSPEHMDSYVIGNQLHMSTSVEIEKVRVYNSSGQLVLNSDYKEVTNISTLISGIYFYQLIGEKEIYTGQFYVVK